MNILPRIRNHPFKILDLVLREHILYSRVGSEVIWPITKVCSRLKFWKTRFIKYFLNDVYFQRLSLVDGCLFYCILLYFVIVCYRIFFFNWFKLISCCDPLWLSIWCTFCRLLKTAQCPLVENILVLVSDG